jgi:hypothetical protein
MKRSNKQRRIKICFSYWARLKAQIHAAIAASEEVEKHFVIYDEFVGGKSFHDIWYKEG